MSINEVDFGRLDAESDEHLLEYFVDTGVVSRVQLGDRFFIVGRKGSGKSALFRRLGPDKLEAKAVPIDFTNYSWEAHKKLRELGVPPESAYVATWRFTLLITVLLEWSQTGAPPIKTKADKWLIDVYGRDRPKWHEILFDRFRRIRRLDLPSVEGVGQLGGVEFDETQDQALLPNKLGRISVQLEDFVASNYTANPVVLLLDRLDEGWDASSESKQLLIGVAKAARELNLRIIRSTKAAMVIPFLRSDIYQQLQYNDKNKMEDDIEHLDWDGDSLVQVVAARIARSLKCPEAEAWDRVFSTRRMRQGASIRSFILKRTMLRPRDMIAFCIHCRRVAMQHGHDRVETDDVYEAEEGYSAHIYNELDDEMHKQLPRARESLQVLRDMQHQRFSLEDWTSALQARKPEATEAEAADRLRELFEYSVVGVQRVGGRHGGSRFHFAYEDKLLQPNFRAQMVVHSSLKKALSLKDRGA